MENTISPSKHAFPYGLTFGVIMILEFVISYVVNIDPISSPIVGTIMNVMNFLILPLVCIALACNYYKNKLNFGFISFSQCLKIGVLVCVIAGIIYAIFSTVFNFIFPEYIDEIMDKTRRVMQQKNPNMTGEQIEFALSWSRKFMNPFIAIPVTILMYAFFGLIYSLIIGAIVKKDNLQYN